MFLTFSVMLTASILLHIAVIGWYGYVGDVQPALARRLILLYIIPGGLVLHLATFVSSFVVDTIARRPLDFPLKDFIEDYKDLPSVIAEIWEGPKVV
jgi:hypothetical protein